jgi:hypothetical protein
MIGWDEFRERVRRLEAERQADILAREPSGRAPGRRPRDPEQEALLVEADRRRISESELLAKAKRVSGSGEH